MSAKFTIVVPTRERCDTLAHTLRTCVAQDYDNLEILVSDNFSQDETRDVVSSFKDARIRYVNPERRLSMTGNWEYALSFVNQGYVSFIGDDDGFMPGAVAEVATKIRDIGDVSAFMWHRANYKWPNYFDPDERNTLSFQLGSQLSIARSADALQCVSEYKCSWGSLPSIYSSFISMEVIDAVKKQGGNVFFKSSIPDVYSAVAISSMTPTFWRSTRPYSLAGLSQKSNGAAFSNRRRDARLAQQFVGENDIPIHPNVVMSHLACVCVTECLLKAEENGLLPKSISVSIPNLIRAALLEASEEPAERYESTLDDLRLIGARNGISDYVEKQIAQAIHVSPISHPPVSARDLRRQGIVIDCSKHRAHDVYAASLLCQEALRSPGSYTTLWGTARLAFWSYAPFIAKQMRRLLRRGGLAK